MLGLLEAREKKVREEVARLREEAERVRAALDAAESTLARPSEARETVAEVPTGRLRARLTSMADQTGIAITAVDPAYTSRWGAQHRQKPLTSSKRKTTRHDAAAVAIGRRAQGHPPP